LVRLFTIIGALTLLVGCTSDEVHLRHPQTGKTVKCGPYSTTTREARFTAVEHERGCIQDYQRQGYERVMD
jgi:hypothetical protein